MHISLNIILDVLAPYRHEVHLSTDRKLSFSRCLPLPDDAADMMADCIYVGGLSKALAQCGTMKGCCCICLRDRVTDEAETGETLGGFIIINENITQTALLVLVQNRFFAINDWIYQMHEAMIHDGTMQDIVDLCAPVIDNFIAISDSSLMLLAHSRTIPCDDPIITGLVTYGYHPEDSIQKFREHDLFKLWETAEGIYIDDTRKTATYTALNKIFRFHNVYFAHAVLMCNRNPPTPGMIDMFQLFIDVLAVYIEHAWQAKGACNHIYDTFLTDLIEGNISSKKVIEERSHYVGIPVTGRFCLFQIISNNSANMSIGKMLMEFSDLFPRFKFIRYQQRIVAIHNFSPNEDLQEQQDTIGRSLDTFLEKYDALCGTSLFFNTLDELPYSFKQSSLALAYFTRLREHTGMTPLLKSDKQGRVVHFSSSYIYCLLGEHEGNAELWYHSDYHRTLKKLYDYDQRHKSNTIQILQTYLNLERSATDTGAALNMHRNNVLYHVGRIEEMLGIDFDNPSVRLMTMLSFVLLELYGLNDA